MNNLIMWNLIVGFLAPNLIAILQNPKMSSTVRSIITFVVAIVGGGFTAYLNGQFNLGDIVGSILVVGVAAITFYKGLWSPTGVAPAIENATSGGSLKVEQAHPDDAPRSGRGDIGATTTHLVLVVLAVIGAFVVLAWLVR